VVVVSESVAKRFWPGLDAIGRTVLTEWGPEEADEVIGVVGDIRTVKLDAPPVMMVYVPDWFGTLHLAAPQSAGIVVRTSGKESGVAAAVRQAIHATDPEVPIVALRPISEAVSESAAPRRFQMLLALVFALAALLLASLGIYGVIAYTVELRRHELGIRAALGAILRFAQDGVAPRNDPGAGGARHGTRRLSSDRPTDGRFALRRQPG
jgi:hypothetical protein